MSNSPDKPSIRIIPPRPEHFLEIQELCKKVYPFSKPWSIEQLESHHSYFPGGQLIAINETTGKVVGLAFSLIVSWDDYSPQDNWADFTGSGFFKNHDPKKGRTLYGAEVMVDPEMRGLGIGKLLYKGRQEIVEKYSLKRIRAGARLRGYSKYQDKLTPHEYVIQVVQRKIFDPTLSFQLSQGFVVIDVAKNYLFNDPESLGYAAVIEWLNPKQITPRDLKKQQDSVQVFLNQEKYIPEYLPKELNRLVRKTTLVLGDIIRECEGPDFYHRIEQFRQYLKKMRISTTDEKLSALMNELQRETPAHQLKIAHAFALQLELVNACETSYRTWRQRQKLTQQSSRHRVDLKFVLTAHPTEARSPVVVELLQEIVDLLMAGMYRHFVFSEKELYTKIRMLWRLPLSKTKAPKVVDEADYIFSLIFSRGIFDSLVSEKPNYDLKLRTWVGGDKDGHPGVNAEVMKDCLNLSRRRLCEILRVKLRVIQRDLLRVHKDDGKKTQKLKEVDFLVQDLNALIKIQTGDGNRVKKWKIRFSRFLSGASPLLKDHYEVRQIQKTLEMFPAIVLPIELREDAQLIAESLDHKSSPIRKMLVTLSQIAGPLSVVNYARGLVISHCESAADLEAAKRLIGISTHSRQMPAIPLFESKSALEGAREIVREYFQKKANVESTRRYSLGYFEVMLGYSDSAKEIGVFPSRCLIRRAMADIESALRSKSLKPVFFHGSGGSVARGGGSLKEQISWWPNSAIERPKITIQGEMVQRTFATPEILNSQCNHLSDESIRRKMRRNKKPDRDVLSQFSETIERKYVDLTSDSNLLESILRATPYRYLELLRIGSRPTKRPKQGGVTTASLRAIPWVLCWTQTRSLLPTWWGVGSAWENLNSEEKNSLKEEYKENSFFSSFVKSLGFTLAKVEPAVWKQYFSSDQDSFFKSFEKELALSKNFIASISGEKNLIWYRPWLEESIRLRSPHIHLLNLLQVIAIRRNDEALLKETLVGIACGMLTTG